MLLCKKCIRISTNADVMMMAKDELVGLVSCEIVWRMFRASLPIYLIQEVDPDYHPISFILSISAKLNFKKKDVSCDSDKKNSLYASYAIMVYYKV